MRPWWLRLAPFVRPELPRVLLVVSLIVAGSAFEVLKPWPLKILVDGVLAGRPLPPGSAWLAWLPGAGTARGLLAWLTGGTVGLFLAAQAINVARAYVQTGVSNRLQYAVGAELLDRLQRLSLGFHTRRSAGDLVQRVLSDSTCVQRLVSGVIISALTSLASLLLMSGIMWRLDPTLALVAFLVMPPLGLLIRLFDGPMTRHASRQQELEGEMTTLAEQALSALPAIQAFGREDHESARFRDLSRQTLRASLRTVMAQLRFKFGTGAVMAAGTAAVMLLGGLGVLQGTLKTGDLLVILSYLASLYSPLETLAYLSAGYASASARAKRVLEVLDEESEVRESPNAVAPAAPCSGRLVLEGVTAGYSAGQPVLCGVSLELRPGEVVALVGATGAGKSTLAALIPRFLDPWEGRVLLDGVDLRELTLSGLRSQVSLVLQEPFLLPLSVAENIAYGRAGASRAEVEAAAALANADEFIRRLPQGYDTLVGERGARLSGGQRQRLSIARALLKDAPVLVLDEPTSALDGRTEGAILEGLGRLMSGRTTLMIAHRLATVERSDRVVVLDGGRVVEEGTPGELLARGGVYHSLNAAQRVRQAERGVAPERVR